MNDQALSNSRTEAALVFRWILLFPTFGILVLLAANFSLGFFQWLVGLEGALFYAMIPVGAIIVLSNGLASFISCMVAPRKRPAVALLGVGHFAGMLYGYFQFEWSSLTAVVLILHALMVYGGLTLVYYLDLLHAYETGKGETAESQPTS
jgi:hypothetical protein